MKEDEIVIFDRGTKFKKFQKSRAMKKKKKKGLIYMLIGFIFANPDYIPGMLHRLRMNKKGMAGLWMLAIAILVAILAPYLIMYDPVTYLADDEEFFHPPTFNHLLGTDVMGRDIYSQIIWGFRSALLISLPSALFIGVIGTIVGLVSGYYGGITDGILQRISLTFLVWPSIPLVALIVFSWGGESALPAIMLGVSLSLWPTTARVIRGEVMSLRNRPFIEVAKISGASSARILFRHILPNVIHLTFLYITIAVASVLVLEATFNFLGLTNPGVITWGQMLSFAYHASTARFGLGGFLTWWTILPPGLAIAYMVLSFYLISSGLKESMRMASPTI